MEEWIQALKVTSEKDSYHSNKELLSGIHNWYVCSHARPTFCNVCREALNGVTSHGLSCEVCKFKVHKRCAPKAPRNCKWTTLASIGPKEIIEDEMGNIHMSHQWIEGNLPVNARCSYCEKACGSVLRMQDFRCLWCKAYVHNHCKDKFYDKCNFGVCRVSILTPIHINTVASDGYIRASKPHNTSPLVVFVNSKSGDNQGVKFLRKFKQLLNPFQVFDLIEDGPVMGLRLFQNFDCFRVLVCGGDGSVGWVLKEIDNLNLHKQCQIGVLPLGTGNDLARVLGWGAALDDDNQLAKLLEFIERATTKMLDRWSMMTYEVPLNSNSANEHVSGTSLNRSSSSHVNTTAMNNQCASKSALNSPMFPRIFDFNQSQVKKLQSNDSKNDIPIGISNYTISHRDSEVSNDKLAAESLSHLEDSIWYHLRNMLQNENINNVIDSSQILQSKVTEALIRVNDMYNNYSTNVNDSMSSVGAALANDNENKKRMSLWSSAHGGFEGDEDNRIMNAMAAVVTDQCILLKHKLNMFFSLLKSELKTEGDDASSHSASESSDSADEQVMMMPINPHAEAFKKLDSFSSRSSFNSLNYASLTDKNKRSNQGCAGSDSNNKRSSKLFLNVNNKNAAGLGGSSVQETVQEDSQQRQELHQSSSNSLNNITNNPLHQGSVNMTSGSKSTTENIGGIGSCNSSINRRLMMNSISKLFRHRRTIMTHANSLKKSIKQILQLADKNNTINSMISTTSAHFMKPDTNNTNGNANNSSIVSNGISNNIDSMRNSITSHLDPDMSITDSDTKRLLVRKIENMDDLISYRHLSYDVYEDDFDVARLDMFKNCEMSCDAMAMKQMFRVSYEHRESLTDEIDIHIDNDECTVDNKTDARNGLYSPQSDTQNIETNPEAKPTSLATANLLDVNNRRSEMESNSPQQQNPYKKRSSSIFLNLNDLFDDTSKFENKKLSVSESFSSGKINEAHDMMQLGTTQSLSSVGACMNDMESNSSGSGINPSNPMHKCPTTGCHSSGKCHKCPLASEEQSCISTPTQTNTNASLSIESFLDEKVVHKSIFELTKKSQVPPVMIERNPMGTPTNQLSRPNRLNLQLNTDMLTSNLNQLNIQRNQLTTSNDSTAKLVLITPLLHNTGGAKQQKSSPRLLNQVSNSTNTTFDQTPPQINITITDTACDNNQEEVEYDSDLTRVENSRSPSFMGYLTSQSSLAMTPTDVTVSNKNRFAGKKTKLTPPPLFLLPPSASSSAIKNKSSGSHLNLNSSSSSNNLSARFHDFNLLRLPASPSGYSSSGSCYSAKSSLQPSPRISKKYSAQNQKTSSTYHLKLPGKRGISALSSTFRQRSLSKSSDKSSSPTSPSSPKFLFKYNPSSSPFGFVSQALMFNTDTLCAPIAAVNPEPLSELFSERAVMNNYFGIGLDAKLSLEFHMTREEHPEKMKSRMRNYMFYGMLGSKELVQRTFKNLEQRVLLECDGTKIPLKNVQGIVVLNIPSYTGGVNFWGHNSKTEHTFTVPSFDDKILEVVAVSGCMQMALSRVVSIKSNRIAQCRSVKIQILGNEGVPVQVDGEAWMQPPGFIYLVHKNRAQMLTRNKVFEHTLKTWSEKQKNDPSLSMSLNKDEFNTLQYILDDSITLIKRIKTASLKNAYIEQDLYGYATQASSNLDEICINGRIIEKSLRQQVTDFLNSIRTLHVETGLFINEKATKLNIDPETIEKIQSALGDLKISMKKLNDCHGLFQFPIDTDEASDDLDFKKKSRFNLVQRYKKSKIKHRDNKELLKTLHGIPIEEWGTHEVALWLESINMGEYKTAFLRHDIRGTEIRNLDRRDLRESGILKVGHIKRILNATKDIPKRVTREKQSV